MKSFYILQNEVQHYAWGSTDGIPWVTGIQNPDKKPMAELWMGTHPAACSKIRETNVPEEKPLTDIAISDMNALAGSPFPPEDGLPFLFKVLSAATPLSLQVHPTKDQAIIGFERENRLDIPIDAPERNYRDSNHKPEIMAALTPFTAMCGFRAVRETLAFLKALELPAISHVLDALEATEDYRDFTTELLSLDKATATAICGQLDGKITRALQQVPEGALDYRLALKTSKVLLSHYPGDVGVLAPFYLNVIVLQPGEALYLPAGIMHAYLEGTGLELMASSDNVLRGGLTPKHIDAPELSAILDPKPFKPDVLKASELNGAFLYPTPAPDFLLGNAPLGEHEVQLPRVAPTIIICTDGAAVIESNGGESLKLVKGTVCYVTVSDNPARLTGNGKCWFATLPLGPWAAT